MVGEVAQLQSSSALHTLKSVLPATRKGDGGCWALGARLLLLLGVL